MSAAVRPVIVVQPRVTTTHKWVVSGRCQVCREYQATAECAKAAQLGPHRERAAEHVRRTGHRVRLHIIEVVGCEREDGIG